MKKFLKKFILILSVLFLFLPAISYARENVDYWYIKNFDSEMIVNKDSTLNVTEKIIADCGQCVDKHGIFRVLPTQVYKDKNVPIKTPISLQSITDFSGHALKYSQSVSNTDHTITWKIGDAAKTVQGINEYEIKYSVKNAIRFDNPDFDEFYWNLNGNFWDIEIDKFSAKISFPPEVNQNNAKVDYYTGAFGSTDKSLATYKWIDKNTLEFNSTQTLKVGEGITASVTFPKGIFTPYVPSFWEKYGQRFYLFIPLLVLILCFFLWEKLGKDPKINPTVAPEFDIPEGLNPMELGVVMTDGTMRSQFISASIINLAVKKFLKIEKTRDDYKLKLLKSNGEISASEKLLLGRLFGSEKEIMLSDLENEFFRDIPAITENVSEKLIAKKFILPRSRILMVVFLAIAGITFFLSFSSFAISGWLGLALILSAIIWLIFAFLMRVRTMEGAELLRKIKGFRLYMETAEKYRQRFLEKENVFERFLPYAMVFGITSLWISKMKLIYGEDYFNRYMPFWFYGAAISSFDANTFNSAISLMSSNMSSTLSSAPSSSGGGGGGFSGGGGGGGGGGGW